jgi:hypothetical protein
VSFAPLRGWVPLEELMGLSLAERIRYVRENLPTSRPRARNPHMSHDDFAAAVGAPDRQAPMRWEKGGRPRAYADKIAELTPYPPAAFGAPGEAELVRETLGLRLRRLEATVAELDQTQELLLQHLEIVRDGDGGLVPARKARRSRPPKAAREGSAS